MNFKKLVDSHKDRDFLLCCPGKNVRDNLDTILSLVSNHNLITIGSNRISELIYLDYHMFTNNDKYDAYGDLVKTNSVLLLGSHILSKHIKKHNPKRYVSVNYTDRDPKEAMRYHKKRDIIYGYYRTSGNLAIMLCYLMGARKIYVAGMSGFTFEFDGDVHYYKAEIKRDKKSKKEWLKRYDRPVSKSLDNLKRIGIDFSLITPTVYRKHYDPTILREKCR